MNAFEHVVRLLLEEENYWVRHSEKVYLTKEEKAATGKHSIPRPEIDLVAHSREKNQILLIEAKSLLDSPGVRYERLCAEQEGRTKGSYKLFTHPKYREIVLRRLHEDFISNNLANSETQFILGLVAGKVYQNRSEEIADYFAHRGWFFWGPQDVNPNYSPGARR